MSHSVLQLIWCARTWSRIPTLSYSECGTYDIRHSKNGLTTDKYYEFLLMTSTVMEALGVVNNFTNYAPEIQTAFHAILLTMRDIGYLLDHKRRVVMGNGDTDYICKWLGGHAFSLFSGDSMVSADVLPKRWLHQLHSQWNGPWSSA